jgi:parallel beta-helix repeat protein
MMNKTAAITLVCSVLLASLLFVSAGAQPALPTIYIKQDGGVDPSTAPIRRDGDIYTFTGDTFARISVQRGNIVIDGAGYTLRGPYNGTKTDIWIIGQGPNQQTQNNDTFVPFVIGIDLGGDYVSGITIKNLNIKNFSIGMYIWTVNNTVTGNNVSENLVGILLSGTENAITRNYIGKNDMGIFFGVNQPGEIPVNIEVSHNYFDHNAKHLSGCICKEYNQTEQIHTWDDGKEGNYWSDYNGTDGNDDGIGDTPYVVDVLNQDRYPLMQNPVTVPTVAWAVPPEIVIALLAVAAIAVTAVITLRKRRKTNQTRTEPT